MQTSLNWKTMVEERIEPVRPSNDNLSCRVGGCGDDRLVTVASDRQGDVMLCVHHALSWAKSSPCRDYAQHNSSASLRLLGGWLQRLSA